MKIRSKLVLYSILAATLTLAIAAERVSRAASPSGADIARKAAAQLSGYGDQQASLKMILKNAHGNVATRAIRFRTLEDKGGQSYALIIFDSPADVKGTALLTHDKRGGDDDQWLYLPALRRVRRISSSNRTGRFVGSEFSYEDLSGYDAADYHWKRLADRGGHYVIEARPKRSGSGYSRRVLLVSKKGYRIEQITFFDRKNARVKTLSYSRFSRPDGKHERALRWTMVNHESGKSTVLEFSNFRFNQGLTVSQFSKSRLRRLR
ncbi:MAG: outer membrane lipoprotein-sorting protein [Myxococcales bacterium]|nr:outer membrane lipoprotein-sorting protein [Myxococcales bacterium]